MKISFGCLIWFIIIAAILALCPFAYSQNLQLIGSCSLPACNWFSAVWVDGNYAYVTRNDNGQVRHGRFIIINISNPSNPFVLGTEEELGRVVEDLCTFGDYAYLAYLTSSHDPGGGLEIMDISDRTNPLRISRFYSGPWGHRLYKQKDMVYLADCEIDLAIIDVSNPFQPRMKAVVDTPWYFESDGIFVQGVYAYIADWFDGLFIYNIQNPASPQGISHLDIPQFNEGDIVVYGNYAFIYNDENVHNFFNGIKVIDVSDPQHPFVAGEYSIDYVSFLYHNIFLDPPYLFIANHSLYALDISDPLHPQLVGEYIYPYPSSRGIFDIFSRNGLIYATSDSSLKIFQFTPTGIENENLPIPPTISLLPNHPNPFNTETTIEYSLPSPGQINLEIYDIQGRKIATLFKGLVSAGNHSAIWNATDCSSGLYFVRLADDNSVITKKIMLLK